jgi:phosphoglycolate phosphatase
VEASRAALLEVYGIAHEAPDRPGDTAPSHTRRALRLAGLSDTQIDAELDRWCEAMEGHYVRLLPERDTSGWVVAEAAAEVLAAIPRRALLTGNPEAVARARLGRIGLAHLFPPGHGAFGCEREDRVALFELAREREGGWPAAATVAIGDTPLDVSSAHAASARCVGVTTGRYGPAELADADRVIRDLRQLPDALTSLAGGDA